MQRDAGLTAFDQPLLVEKTLKELGSGWDFGRRIASEYPFTPPTNAWRKYSAGQYMEVFVRDGFIDRYSGRRLVFPGTLRLLSLLLLQEFPFHPNWKTDACHFAFWELFPTIDVIVPVSRGGLDREDNWVSTSMLLNAAKANFTLEELGWSYTSQMTSIVGMV